MKQKPGSGRYEKIMMSKVHAPPETPHQLHPFLKDRIGYCFSKAALKVRSFLDAELEQWGVVGPQFGMLLILRSGGSVNQIELGRCMHIDKATMVRLIDSLEEMGFVTRTTLPEDRRSKRLSITKAGLQVLEKMERASLKAEEQAYGHMTAAEKKTLHLLLKKVLRIED